MNNMEHNQDKIDWVWLCNNPAIFEHDKEYYLQILLFSLKPKIAERSTL